MNYFIVLLAKDLLYIIALVGFGYFLTLDKTKKISMIKLAIPSGILALILAYVGGLLISDPRPFVVEKIQPLLPHAADNGFPSDHTLFSAFVACVIYAYNKKLGIALFVLAIIVGLARVLAHVHHSLDIVGSLVIAVMSVLISHFVLKRYKQI